MQNASKSVAWICILSTLFSGCYSYMLIDPNGLERDKISSCDIEYVVTKDSTRYDFRWPPDIREGAVVGWATAKLRYDESGIKVTVPLSDLAETGMTKSGAITYVLLKNGGKYTFDQPPSIVDNCVVGRIKDNYSGETSMGGVSIALSDITAASVSRPDYVMTVFVLVGSVSVAVAVLFALTFAEMGSTQ